MLATVLASTLQRWCFVFEIHLQPVAWLRPHKTDPSMPTKSPSGVSVSVTAPPEVLDEVETAPELAMLSQGASGAQTMPKSVQSAAAEPSATGYDVTPEEKIKAPAPIGHKLHSDTHFHGRHQMQCLVG